MPAPLRPPRPLYRLGWALALCAALLTVWTTIVRDDASAEGHFMIVLAVAVGAAAARFDANGLARAMMGIAAMTMAMGLLMATDPTTPERDRAMVWTAVLTALWVGSATLFSAAARTRAPSAPHPNRRAASTASPSPTVPNRSD